MTSEARRLALWAAAWWLWFAALAVAFTTPPMSGGHLIGATGLTILGGVSAAAAIIRKA